MGHWTLRARLATIPASKLSPFMNQNTQALVASDVSHGGRGALMLLLHGWSLRWGLDSPVTLQKLAVAKSIADTANDVKGT